MHAPQRYRRSRPLFSVEKRMLRITDLHTLARICTLKAGPQDLRYSPSLLLATVALSVLLSFGVMAGVEDSGASPGSVALQTLLGLAMPRALLQLRQRSGRFVQTASAVFGTSLLLTVALLPALAVSPGPAAALWWLLIVLWSIAVLGHILAQALDLSRSPALAIALLYFGFSVWLGEVLR
jgi:hypothetical protein